MKVHAMVKMIIMFALCSLFVLTGVRAEESSLRKINPFRKHKIQKTSNSDKVNSTKVKDTASPSKATQISPTTQIKQGFERLGQGTTAAISKTKGMLVRNIKWPTLKRIRMRKSGSPDPSTKKPEKVAKRASQKKVK